MGKGREVSMLSLVYQLLIPALGARRGTCREENFKRGIGKYHGAHVAAVRHQSRRLPEGALTLEQRAPHLRHFSDFGRQQTDRLLPDFLCNFLFLKEYLVAAEGHVELPGGLRRHSAGERDQPV